MERQRQLDHTQDGPGAGPADSTDPYGSAGGLQRRLEGWSSIARESAAECDRLADARGELQRRAQGSGQ